MGRQRMKRDIKWSRVALVTAIVAVATAVIVVAVGMGGCSPEIDRQTVNSEPEQMEAKSMKKGTFAAGCFWGVEAAFRRIEGVLSTQVGYTGGKTEDPSYRQVCGGRTGHAEAVEISFDPKKVTYEDLLEVFWVSHDPTQLNRQGPDVGSQYRSAIFYHDEDQKAAALASIKGLSDAGRFDRPIVTEVIPALAFYRAEEYHQQYLEKRGSGACPSQ
jgi:peptide-methionine (S)-S-oxide reductase